MNETLCQRCYDPILFWSILFGVLPLLLVSMLWIICILWVRVLSSSRLLVESHISMLQTFKTPITTMGSQTDHSGLSPSGSYLNLLVSENWPLIPDTSGASLVVYFGPSTLLSISLDYYSLYIFIKLFITYWKNQNLTD